MGGVGGIDENKNNIDALSIEEQIKMIQESTRAIMSLVDFVFVCNRIHGLLLDKEARDYFEKMKNS